MHAEVVATAKQPFNATAAALLRAGPPAKHRPGEAMTGNTITHSTSCLKQQHSFAPEMTATRTYCDSGVSTSLSSERRCTHTRRKAAAAQIARVAVKRGWNCTAAGKGSGGLVRGTLASKKQDRENSKRIQRQAPPCRERPAVHAENTESSDAMLSRKYFKGNAVAYPFMGSITYSQSPVGSL